MDPSETLVQQVWRAVSNLGLGGGTYKLIRTGTNDVFVSDQDRIVVRVAPTYIDPEDIRSRLLDCRELAAAGAPILLPLVDEVVLLAGGRYASFWPLAQSEIEFDGHDMAAVLNACHRLQPPDRLIEWTPDLFVDRRWATLKEGVEAGLPPDIANSLSGVFTDALDRLKEICRQRYGPSASSFIHGDAHYSNFVRYRDRLVLCDPDNICRGPREKDLANVWECCRRGYINPGYWEQFTASYLLDYDQELLEVLTRVQEVGGCMWMTQFWGSRPESRSAVAHCLETIDQPTTAWFDF